jgi:hypothetical protein
MKKRKSFLTEFLFWLHFIYVFVWLFLFFIPKSLWQGVLAFHFWYIIGIMAVQLLWALILTEKVDLICPLTTLMQSLRGYPVKNEKNYGHSFIAEFLERYDIKLSFRKVNAILILTLAMVVIQYFWFR